MQKINYVGANELGNCPASVDMVTGEIDINRDVFKRHTQFEKDFIIEHEKGHYILQTDSESEADRYALEQMHGKTYRSLKKSLELIGRMGIKDPKRFTDLYLKALQIDAEKNNNIKAKQEIKRILNLEKMNYKIRSNSAFITGNPLGVMESRNFSDGGISKNISENRRLKRGFTFSGHFITYESAILAIIALLLIFKFK